MAVAVSNSVAKQIRELNAQLAATKGSKLPDLEKRNDIIARLIPLYATFESNVNSAFQAVETEAARRRLIENTAAAAEVAAAAVRATAPINIANPLPASLYSPPPTLSRTPAPLPTTPRPPRIPSRTRPPLPTTPRPARIPSQSAPALPSTPRPLSPVAAVAPGFVNMQSPFPICPDPGPPDTITSLLTLMNNLNPFTWLEKL